jgi:ABC-type nickel/cobalt efflux system permease component RcnA
MNPEILALYAATFSVAFFHTMSPDHWMPFVMFGRAKKWPIIKTELVALLAGIGHIGTSVIIAVIGIVIGAEISKNFASIAEVVTGAALIIFGFGYAFYMWSKGGHVHFTIGGKYLAKNIAEHEHSHDEGHEHSHDHEADHDHSHSHAEAHEHEESHEHSHAEGHEHTHEHEEGHEHSHSHEEGHIHSHGEENSVALQKNADGLANFAEIHSHVEETHTHDHDHGDSHQHSHVEGDGHVHYQDAKSPYALVLIMGLTPCVALLPMAFAASHFGTGVTVATIVLFTVSTLIPILGLTFLGSLGLGALKLDWFEKYGDIITGVVIGCIGLMTTFLGL